ncbi:hypothetical protein BT69DRAFT_1291344, partial [Atractiella rhizophila]
MGKNENGAGTDLYSAGDGTEEGARSIVTKLGKKMAINGAPFGLLFGGNPSCFSNESLRPMDFTYCVPTSMMSSDIELS